MENSHKNLTSRQPKSFYQAHFRAMIDNARQDDSGARSGFQANEIVAVNTNDRSLDTAQTLAAQVERQKGAGTVSGYARCCAWPNPRRHR